MRKFTLLLICVIALCGAQFQSVADAIGAPAGSAAVNMQTRTIRIAPKCVACTVGLVNLVTQGDRYSIESGSGVLVSADGLILTAGHVIQSPGTKLTVRFTDGKVVQGVAVGLDHAADTGLVKITDPAPPAGWPFCAMAPSDSATLGEWVLATGNPGSIVVGRNPPLRLGRVVGHEAGAIATNCALEPGDSGGPVFDLDGQVVGINSRIMTGRGNNRALENLSLHVPISMYHAQWKQLLAGMNANPDFNLDGGFPRSRPIPGISPRSRAALNRLAAGHDPEALRLLEVEKKTGKLSPPPAMMLRLLKLAAQMDRDGELAVKHAPAKVANARQSPTTQPRPGVAGASPNVHDSRGVTGMGRLPINRDSIGVSRISPGTLSVFAPSIAAAGDCVVEITDGSHAVLLGTVVGGNGWIITKASDLPAKPRVRLPDGTILSAKLVGKDTATDLALLKIDTTGLVPVRFIDSKTPASAPVGEWLAAPVGVSDQPAFGIVSDIARPIPETFSHFEGEQKVVLGVGFRGDGLTIMEITHGMPADISGMKLGDVVFQFNGNPVANHDQFVKLLKKCKTGDRASIMVHRGNKDVELKPVIGKARATTQTASSIGEADNVAGGKLSKRRTNFPMAIQTDAPVWANECGGPLVNLQGQAIGITIARYDRVCTFALPAKLVQATVAKLKAGE